MRTRDRNRTRELYHTKHIYWWVCPNNSLISGVVLILLFLADICPYHISGVGENNPDLMNGDVDLDIPDGIPPDFDQVPDQPIIQLPQLGEEESEEDDYEDGLEQQLVAQQMMDEEIHPNANNQADNEDDPFAVHSSEADQRAEFSPQALVVIHDPLSSSEDEHENNAVNGENYEEEAKGSAKLTPEPGA